MSAVALVFATTAAIQARRIYERDSRREALAEQDRRNRERKQRRVAERADTPPAGRAGVVGQFLVVTAQALMSSPDGQAPGCTLAERPFRSVPGDRAG